MSKILIAYATKYGSVQKCAEALAAKLDGDVRLLNLKSERGVDIDGFDSVIIGGSIYAGRIQKEVKSFCSINLSKLRSKKIGLFICSAALEDTGAYIKANFPAPLVESALAAESFGGEMNFSKMGFFDRLLTKLIAKASKGALDTDKDRSFIDYGKIAAFAAKF